MLLISFRRQPAPSHVVNSVCHQLGSLAATLFRSTAPMSFCLGRSRAVVFSALLCVGNAPAQAQDQSALSLEEALGIAATRSLQLSAQRQGIGAAEQLVVSARQLPDPKAILGLENVPVTGPDAFSLKRDFMTMAKIGLMQEFTRAEKRELKGKLAERVVAKERAMLVESQAALRREVASAWVERYFAERMGAIVDEQIAEMQLQIETLRAGLKTGKTSPEALLSAQVSVQALLDRRANFAREAARGEAMLSRWLGDAANRPLGPFAPGRVPKEVTAVAERIAQHPHLQALDRQVEVAQTDAALARASVKPDWSLEVAYQQRGPNYSNMVSAQVSIDLPFFQERRQKRDIVAKQALVQQTEDLKEDALRASLAEARVAWTDWNTAAARLKRFDESLLPMAQQRARIALAAYRGGRAELASVLVARRDEIDLKLQKLQLSADQARAYAELLYFLPPGAHQ